MLVIRARLAGRGRQTKLNHHGTMGVPGSIVMRGTCDRRHGVTD